MSTGKSLASHVALLRGINVGGNNKLPMKELAGLFAEAGCAEVQTYIQSGNVIFRATAATARQVPTLVGEQIAARFGFRCPLILRTARELAAVAEGNPFKAAVADPHPLHVYFLADAPTASQVAALDPKRSPPDEFAVRGKEIYLRCPEGVGNTKLTNAYFDGALKTVSTARNWRTLLKLIELSSAPG